MAVQRNTAGKAPKKRRRKLSKRQRAIYRRRRIVVGVLLAVFLALAVFCVYSISRGVGFVYDATFGSVSHAVMERSTAPEPHHSSGVRDCSAKDTRLELTAKSATVPVGGSLEWVATIVHEGNDSCLLDASDSGRVLTITQNGQKVWSSDVCPVDARRLLMAKGDKDIQSITWGANSTTDGQCVENQDELPKVDRGTYVGVLRLKNAPKVKSQPVTIEVQ
ncbi:hypothetical protein [Bifidobacterium saguinibicoloris]|uniref:hypothetical protein n=1 Tax=Bifidobacterium saguinibicoloris TaxID=2834433 RepID=UPI001C584C56|nr:hypothetical protein [Bifidobacterium saguinibicoloris]MBW3081223.1 hypothetical protein [Bifidobacterium saguinibicoloris]